MLKVIPGRGGTIGVELFITEIISHDIVSKSETMVCKSEEREHFLSMNLTEPCMHCALAQFNQRRKWCQVKQYSFISDALWFTNITFDANLEQWHIIVLHKSHLIFIQIGARHVVNHHDDWFNKVSVAKKYTYSCWSLERVVGTTNHKKSKDIICRKA